MSDTPEEKPAASTLVDSTLDEHRGCMQLVTELEECLDRHPEDRDRWIADLRDKLTQLRGTLREHFASEEQGPLFGQLPALHPRLASPLGALQQEHGTLLTEIEGAIDNADRLHDAETYELRELNARVQLLIAKIRRHEAAENELVMEAYWAEVGVGD